MAYLAALSSSRSNFSFSQVSKSVLDSLDHMAQSASIERCRTNQALVFFGQHAGGDRSVHNGAVFINAVHRRRYFSDQVADRLLAQVARI